MRSVHRAHFLGELIKEVPAECVHFNKRLLDLEETEEDTVTLHFDDGTSVTADVAIGVDGIHSKVRQIMMGVELATPVFAGTVVHRGTVPMEKASEALGAKHAHNATLLCGPGRFLQFQRQQPQSNSERRQEYHHLPDRMRQDTVHHRG